MKADKPPTPEERYGVDTDERDRERDSRTWFTFPPYGWLPWPSRHQPYDAYGEVPHEDVDREPTGDSWWDEGLISLLFIVGVALFLFPEPATSGLGIALVVVATILWLVDVAT